METDKQVSYNQSNSVSRELFVNMSNDETLSEKMTEIELEEDGYEDEEPIDNSQL
jgi:hypothetical protein